MEYTLAKPQFGGGNFAAATFTPMVFNPKQADMSLLAHSIDELEQRKEKAETQKLAVAEAFSKARDLLPDNEETNQYITQNQDRVMNSINEMINIGDMGGALKVARNLAGDFTSSPEFIARTKEHRQRTAWLDDLDKSGVDQYIKDYYKDIYSDKNNFTRDANGNITGTAGFKAPLPEQGVSATAIIEQAIKDTRDERTDEASSWGKTNADRSGGSGHRQISREWLTADKISSTAKSIINNNPRVRQAFVDQFNAGIHQINKLQKQLGEETDPIRRAELQNQVDGYKKSFYKNGAPLSSADAYVDNLFSTNNDAIKNAAYDYKHSNKGGTTTEAPLGSGGIDFGLGAAGSEDYLDVKSFDIKLGGYTLRAPERGNRPTSKK